MTQAFNLALLANNVNSSGQLNADAGLYNTVNIANGGTNLSATPTDGQLLIGNGTGYTLSTLTASTGISITNAAGSITLTNTNPNAVVDIQTFNAGDADLTWDKPTTGQTMCRVQVWAGGGGGGRSSTAGTAGGGGGGAYNEWVGPISYMGSTATVTVGAGGTGRVSSNGPGTAGGNSSIDVANYPFGSVTVIAYGGGGGGYGATFVGGGGGGLAGAGQTGGNTTAGLGGKGYSTSRYSTYHVFSDGATLIAGGFSAACTNDSTAGGSGIQVISTINYLAGGSVYGGGGGGSGSNTNYYGGGYSMYGGGGGGYSTLATKGLSVFGGDGGQNTVGETPSGGGGFASGAVNGSNGGAGRVIVTSW